MATCINNHPESSIRHAADKNGRVMTICSDCRRKAREAQATPADRAMSLIDRLLRRRVIDDNGCWIPQIHDNGRGYRAIAKWSRESQRFERFYAHRVAYEHYKGAIPAGFEVDHLCRNRSCFNPDHLEAVTPAENTRRAAAAKTHCVNGHPFSPENVYVRRGGGRQCKACDRERALLKYHADPTAANKARATRKKRQFAEYLAHCEKKGIEP